VKGSQFEMSDGTDSLVLLFNQEYIGQSYKAQTYRYSGCLKHMQNFYVYGKELENDLFLSKIGHVNEPNNPILDSDYDVFSWKVGPFDVTDSTISSFTLSQPGEFNYELIANSKFGCSDTITTNIYTKWRSDSLVSNACSFNPLFEDFNHFSGMNVDFDGNVLVYGVKHDNSAYPMYWVLGKYDSKGQLLWEINNFPAQNSTTSGEKSSFINALEFDEDGNIYAVGSQCTNGKNVVPFIIKFDKNGVELKKKVLYPSSNSNTVGYLSSVSSIEKVKNSLYLSINYPQLANGNYTSIKIVELDYNLDILSTHDAVGDQSVTFYGGSVLWGSYFPIFEGNSYKGTFNGLETGTKGDSALLVRGYFKGLLKFGQHQIENTNDYYLEFRAELDLSSKEWVEANVFRSFMSKEITRYDKDGHNFPRLKYPALCIDSSNNVISSFSYVGQEYEDWTDILFDFGYSGNYQTSWDSYSINEYNRNAQEYTFVESTIQDGSINWRFLMTNAKVEAADYLKAKNLYVITATIESGCMFLGVNEPVGIKSFKYDESVLIGIDASTGELQWVEKVESENGVTSLGLKLDKCGENLYSIHEKDWIFLGANQWANNDLYFKSDTVKRVVGERALLKFNLDDVCQTNSCSNYVDYKVSIDNFICETSIAPNEKEMSIEVSMISNGEIINDEVELEVFLSSDSILDFQDESILLQKVNLSGGHHLDTLLISTSHEMLGDDLSLIVKLDASNQFIESNELDNEVRCPVLIEKVDFQLDSINCEFDIQEEDSVVNVDIEYTVLGDVDSMPISFHIATNSVLYFYDYMADSSFVESCGDSTKCEVQLSFNRADWMEGIERYLFIEADYREGYFETNESNNSLSCRIEFPENTNSNSVAEIELESKSIVGYYIGDQIVIESKKDLLKAITIYDSKGSQVYECKVPNLLSVSVDNTFERGIYYISAETINKNIYTVRVNRP